MISMPADKDIPEGRRTLVSHKRYLVSLAHKTLRMIHHAWTAADIAENEDDRALAFCSWMVVSCKVVCQEGDRWKQEEREDE